MRAIRIGGRGIGEGRVFIVAEAGVNHDGDPAQARRLAEAALDCGADAVKFQTFSADELVLKDAPKVPYQKRAEPGPESHHEMLRRLELSRRDTEVLKKHCDRIGLPFLSTPYDPASVHFLAALGVPAIKVASADLVDFRLHEAVRECRLPLIQGVGMGLEEEIAGMLAGYRGQDPEYPVLLLQCTANYPADPASANLRCMAALAARHQVLAGYSDHTEGDACALAAVALGACLLERHFTLDRSRPGPDHRASVDPAGFKRMVAQVRQVEAALGDGVKRVAGEEADMRRISRKGVYLARDLKAGARLAVADLLFRRPTVGGLDMHGLRPLLGRALRKGVAAGQPLRAEDVG